MYSLRRAITATVKPWRPLYVYAYTCCYCCLRLSPVASSSTASYSSTNHGIALMQQQRHTAAAAAPSTGLHWRPTFNDNHNHDMTLHHQSQVCMKAQQVLSAEARKGARDGGVVRSPLFMVAPVTQPRGGDWSAPLRRTSQPVRRSAVNGFVGTMRPGSAAVTTAAMSMLGGSDISGMGARRSIASSLGSGGSGRGRSGKGKPARGSGGRGSALGMGKGTLRKQAKKLEAKLAGKKGKVPVISASASAASQLGEEPVLVELVDTESFLKAFDYFRKTKAPRRVLQVYQNAQKKEIEGVNSVLLAAAVKAELKLSREDLARQLIEDFGTENWQSWLRSDPDSAQTVVRAACSASLPELAEQILVAAGLSCENMPAEGLTKEARKASASVYPNLITAYSRRERRDDALRLLEAIAKARLAVKISSCNRLLQGFHKRRDLVAVFKVLDMLAASGVDGDEETYEWLANAAVRGVEFVTGAVSMETLPKEPVLPEAAFIGRSNVGKSSLINMVCNRKNVAFTSKRPGKTQQFNYFVVNNHTENAFYIVDMPGMGYAKVPEKQRSAWAELFRSYITRRSCLRVLFHLIDGRHGPVGQDHEIMKFMSQLPEAARYVVVLTKADKSGNNVSRDVLQSVIGALRDAGVSRTPIVLTSATSRQGRDGMWRYLRLAALDKVLRENAAANRELDEKKPRPRNVLDWRDSRRGRMAEELDSADAQRQPAAAASSASSD